MMIGGSNKDQRKDLEKFFPNVPKTKTSLSPQKKWTPPPKYNNGAGLSRECMTWSERSDVNHVFISESFILTHEHKILI